MRTLLGCVAVVAFSGPLAADDKKDEKIDVQKLIGKWELKDKDALPTVVEFQKGGKMLVTFTLEGEKFKLEGTYKIDGNKLLTVAKDEGKEMKDTLTVTKLTDSELAGTSEKGKKVTFARLKDK